MFVINEDGSGDEKIFEYNLSTAFDVSSASYSTSFNLPRSMEFNNDGAKMFVLGWDNSTVGS